MKKMLISLIMLVPLLSGCANVDTMLTINGDKSASVVSSLTYKGDLSSKNDLVAVAISNSYDEFFDSLYNVEKVNSARLSTVTGTKKVDDLSKMDLNLESLGFKSNLPSKKFIEVKKSFLLTSYNIDLKYDNSDKISSFLEDLSNVNSNAQVNDAINADYYHKYADKFEVASSQSENVLLDNLDEDTKNSIMQFLDDDSNSQTLEKGTFTNSFGIQVPSIASSNNADSISGGVYTWTLKDDEPTYIKLQYVQYSGFAIAFIILLGVLLLVVLAARILKHDAQKRVDNIDNIV